MDAQWRRRLPPPADTAPETEPTLIEGAITQPSPDAGGGMVVRLGNGRRSTAVPAGFDGDELHHLVLVLKSCRRSAVVGSSSWPAPRKS